MKGGRGLNIVVASVVAICLLNQVAYGKPVKNGTYNLYQNKAESELSYEEKLHKNAYEAVEKALNERTQESIDEARRAVDSLKGKVDWAIGEFSRQLDEVQNEILATITESINMAKTAMRQGAINEARNNIPDSLPQQWKGSFNAEIDKIQEKLIYMTLEAILQAKQTKSDEDISTAYSFIMDLEGVQNNETVKSLVVKMKEDFNQFVGQDRSSNEKGGIVDIKDKELEKFLKAMSTNLDNRKLLELYVNENLPLEKLKQYYKGEKFFRALREITQDISKEKITTRSYLGEVVEGAINKQIAKMNLVKANMKIVVKDNKKSEIDITSLIEKNFKGVVIDYSSIEYGECPGLIYENKKIYLDKEYLNNSVPIPVKLSKNSEIVDKIAVRLDKEEEEKYEEDLERALENIPEYIEVSPTSRDIKEEIIKIIERHMYDRVTVEEVSIMEETEGRRNTQSTLLEESSYGFRFKYPKDEKRLGIQKIQVTLRSGDKREKSKEAYLILEPKLLNSEERMLKDIYTNSNSSYKYSLVENLIRSCLKGYNKYPEDERPDISEDKIYKISEYIYVDTTWMTIDRIKKFIKES